MLISAVVIYNVHLYFLKNQDKKKLVSLVLKTREKGVDHVKNQRRKLFQKITKIFIIATSLLLLSFTLSIIFSPSFETFKNISNKVPSSLDNAQGLNKLWQYILNNAIRVPFQMFIFSLIPIPFLYF